MPLDVDPAKPSESTTTVAEAVAAYLGSLGGQEEDRSIDLESEMSGRHLCEVTRDSGSANDSQWGSSDY